MAKHVNWNRDQLLLALRLYTRTTFGRLHSRNPEIIDLAGKLGRTPGAVAMKTTNFASLDPHCKRKGLKNAGPTARALWDEFAGQPTKLALEVELAAKRLKLISKTDLDVVLPSGMTEKQSIVKVRLVQSFFRQAVFASYNGKCAVTGISVSEVLSASHIIPWAVDANRRAHPANGILLNALFDRAFDRGLLTFDEDYRVVLSSMLRVKIRTSKYKCSILQSEGKKMRLPERFPPMPECMEYHRKYVFKP